jgi:tRNA (guanine26-N2/guanine27-N2)-dimethyltransferase
VLKKTREIIEGLTRLKIPIEHLNKQHFFNPRVELSRDLTVLVIRALNPKNWVVCDTLAGTGARGIRIAKECKVKKVFLNDFSEENLKFMEENAHLNSVRNKIEVVNQDANIVLSEKIRTFDYIDIDPYGSPTYYFDSSARAIKREGFLGFSATDTAALCGTSPITSFRRYGIESYKTDFFKELGLRILITSAVLSFSKWSFSLEPLLSFASEHYFRVFVRVKKGKSIASKTIKDNFSYVSYCPECLWRSVNVSPITECEFCKSETKIIGKIWVGQIENLSFIRSCERELTRTNWLKTENKIRKLFELLKDESFPFYYDVHKVCSKHGLKIPDFKTLQEKLRLEGFKAEKTHFLNVGIKTDASLKDFIEIISECKQDDF